MRPANPPASFVGTLQALHLFFIAGWAGVLACEALLEFLPAGDAGREQQIALLHYRIDLLLEAPLLAGILVTGVILLGDAQWSLALAIKVVAALVVIGANAACVVVVVRRHRGLRRPGRDAAGVFARDTHAIHWLIYVFTPIGLGVFVLGLVLAGS